MLLSGENGKEGALKWIGDNQMIPGFSDRLFLNGKNEKKNSLTREEFELEAKRLRLEWESIRSKYTFLIAKPIQSEKKQEPQFQKESALDRRNQRHSDKEEMLKKFELDRAERFGFKVSDRKPPRLVLPVIIDQMKLLYPPRSIGYSGVVMTCFQTLVTYLRSLTLPFSYFGFFK